MWTGRPALDQAERARLVAGRDQPQFQHALIRRRRRTPGTMVRPLRGGSIAATKPAGRRAHRAWRRAAHSASGRASTDDQPGDTRSSNRRRPERGPAPERQALPEPSVAGRGELFARCRSIFAQACGGGTTSLTSDDGCAEPPFPVFHLGAGAKPRPCSRRSKSRRSAAPAPQAHIPPPAACRRRGLWCDRRSSFQATSAAASGCGKSSFSWCRAGPDALLPALHRSRRRGTPNGSQAACRSSSSPRQSIRRR